MSTRPVTEKVLSKCWSFLFFVILPVDLSVSHCRFKSSGNKFKRLQDMSINTAPGYEYKCEATFSPLGCVAESSFLHNLNY